MSTAPAVAGRVGAPRRDWLGGAITVATVVAVGVLMGVQYMEPNKRVLAVLAAVVVFGFAWRISMTMGIGVLVLALPFPRATVFGSTTVAFILILLVIWLLRMSTRAAPPPARTPVDLPIVGLLIAYTISFYNIEKASQLGPALTNVQLLVGCILMFYVFVNSVRTSADLARVHVFQCGSALAILLLTVWELNHPGQAFIPGWLNFASSGAIDPTKFELHTMRVGGPFFDFELMCEFCALTILLVIFLLNRPIAPFLKTLLFGLLALATFAMFATVTRGGFIAFLVGLGYLVWHIRRRLSFVPFTIIAAGAIIFILAVNFYVANFTNAGDLFYRLKGTEFVGMMPESRARAWPEAWERMMLHPIIGHGPYYAPSIGDKIYVWPHNVYLFIGNLVGIVGLSFFLLLAGILWVISRPRGDRLDDPSYARGFLLIGHVQLATFLVDQLKIDYLRNPIYQFQVWLLFSSIVAAHLIVRRERAARLAAGA